MGYVAAIGEAWLSFKEKALKRSIQLVAIVNLITIQVLRKN